MTYPVTVTNDGDFTLNERFKGKPIVLKPGESIVMDRDEAVEYAAQYKPIETDGEKNQKPSGYKKLSFEPGLYEAGAHKAANDLLCHANGSTAMSKEELNQMIRDNAHLLADDKAKEALKTDTQNTIAELQAQVKALTEAMQGQGKKSPGRPKKDAEHGKGNPA